MFPKFQQYEGVPSLADFTSPAPSQSSAEPRSSSSESPRPETPSPNAPESCLIFDKSTTISDAYGELLKAYNEKTLEQLQDWIKLRLFPSDVEAINNNLMVLGGLKCIFNEIICVFDEDGFLEIMEQLHVDFMEMSEPKHVANYEAFRYTVILAFAEVVISNKWYLRIDKGFCEFTRELFFAVMMDTDYIENHKLNKTIEKRCAQAVIALDWALENALTDDSSSATSPEAEPEARSQTAKEAEVDPNLPGPSRTEEEIEIDPPAANEPELDPKLPEPRGLTRGKGKSPLASKSIAGASQSKKPELQYREPDSDSD